MTLFQCLILPALTLLLCWELTGWLRACAAFRFRFVRCLVWLTAIGAIADPYLVQILAHVLGIGRGTDVVLYLFLLGFLMSSFYFYARFVLLQKQVTDLVRHIAITSAAQGPREMN